MTDQKGGWLPLDTLPANGTEIVEILMSGGDVVRAPDVAHRGGVPRKIQIQLAEMGFWPDHKNFTPTHWRRIRR